MVGKSWLAAASAVLVLGACAPKPVPDPKPSDDFAAVADKAFVDETTGKLARTFERPERVMFRKPVISQSERGKALCIDAALPDEAWTGMIAVKTTGAAGYILYRAGDNLSAQAKRQCPALVLKYVEEPNVDWYEAEVAMTQAGCAHLDPRYWTAWKRYCNGALTTPASKAVPAA